MPEPYLKDGTIHLGDRVITVTKTVAGEDVDVDYDATNITITQEATTTNVLGGNDQPIGSVTTPQFTTGTATITQLTEDPKLVIGDLLEFLDAILLEAAGTYRIIGPLVINHSENAASTYNITFQKNVNPVT